MVTGPSPRLYESEFTDIATVICVSWVSPCAASNLPASSPGASSAPFSPENSRVPSARSCSASRSCQSIPSSRITCPRAALLSLKAQTRDSDLRHCGHASSLEDISGSDGTFEHLQPVVQQGRVSVVLAVASTWVQGVNKCIAVIRSAARHSRHTRTALTVCASKSHGKFGRGEYSVGSTIR